MSQPVCYSLDCAAHSHLASLQYLLNNELACVPIKTLGSVDVAWITKHVYDALTADAIFHRSRWTTTPCTKCTHPMLHQHTQRFLDLAGGVCVKEGK